MTLVTIALGILGLGVVVFFHELGHFAVARLVGVEVDEFSLGWGPKLASKKLGKTAYTISAFPIGGYCKMKGEDSYRKAIEEGLDEFPREPGTYFGASPFRRILISLGGPAMNVVFAIVAYTLIIAVGYDAKSWENRVLLYSQVDGREYPADQAGLRSGDRLVSMDGRDTPDFQAIQEAVSMSARKRIETVVERDGKRLRLEITPELDKESGAGRIGVYPWIAAEVGSVAKDSAASLAGIVPGDRVVSLDGAPIANTLELMTLLKEGRPDKAIIGIERDGKSTTVKLVPEYGPDGSPELGLAWRPIVKRIRASCPLEALSYGFSETGKTLRATFAGIASLFMGVDVLKAVSGPIRITWMVGTVASDGLSGGQGGLSSTLGFLAMLSIGLFAMNLLPIPLLDGGSIVLFAIELVRRKAAKVKTVFRYQTVGMIAVAAIFIVATVGDMLFFSGR